MAQVVETAYVIDEATQDLYIIDLDNGNVTMVADIPDEVEDPVNGLADIDGLAFDAAGTLYGSDNDLNRFVTINRYNGAVTVVGDFSGDTSAVSDTGLYVNSSGTHSLADDGAETLYSVNTSTVATTEVGPFNTDIQAIAFNSSDVLYGIDNDALVTLDPADGSILTTVPLSVPVSAEQGLHFDGNGTLYMINGRVGILKQVPDG